MFVSVVIEVVVVVNIIYYLDKFKQTGHKPFKGKKIKFYLNEESSQYSKGDNSEVVKTH